MPAHAYNLDGCLQREDGGEDYVDEVQRLEVGVTLFVVLDRHCYHVADDKDDDG